MTGRTFLTRTVSSKTIHDCRRMGVSARGNQSSISPRDTSDADRKTDPGFLNELRRPLVVDDAVDTDEEETDEDDDDDDSDDEVEELSSSADGNGGQGSALLAPVELTPAEVAIVESGEVASVVAVLNESCIATTSCFLGETICILSLSIMKSATTGLEVSADPSQSLLQRFDVMGLLLLDNFLKIFIIVMLERMVFETVLIYFCDPFFGRCSCESLQANM
jgi:hypothetical protein